MRHDAAWTAPSSIQKVQPPAPPRSSSSPFEAQCNPAWQALLQLPVYQDKDQLHGGGGFTLSLGQRLNIPARVRIDPTAPIGPASCKSCSIKTVRSIDYPTELRDPARPPRWSTLGAYLGLLYWRSDFVPTPRSAGLCAAVRAALESRQPACYTKLSLTSTTSTRHHLSSTSLLAHTTFAPASQLLSRQACYRHG